MSKKQEHKKPQSRKVIQPGKAPAIKWYEAAGKYQAWIIFFFAAALYINTINYGYVLDDGLVIKTNTFTLKGISGIPDILTHDLFAGIPGSGDNAIYKGGRYRPLSQVMFAIEYQFFGLSPFVGHLMNIITYGLLGVLIFILLKKLFKPIPERPWYSSIPFLATAIFIAHPIHTEVVANIKSRDEILGLMGGVTAVIFSLKFLDGKNKLSLVFSFLVFFLGLLSKESVITFLAIVPLAIFVFKKALPRDYIIVLLPMVLATVLYFGIRLLVIGKTSGHAVTAELFHNPFMYATTAERYATVMFTWLKYFILLVLPHPLTHDYYAKQIPIIGWADIKAILPLLLVIAMGIFSAIGILKKNILAFGILFFFITFSVTSNLLFDLGLFMNERFMFTPVLGFAIIAAFLLNKIKAGKLIFPLAAVLLFMYSAKTISRNTAWKDDLTLFSTDVKTSVNSGRCNVVAGSLILNEARNSTNPEKQKEGYLLAEEYLKRGLEIYAENSDGWNCLGEVQIRTGRNDEAVKSIREVFKYSKGNQNALNNLSFLAAKYEESNLHKNALNVYEILLKQKPAEPKYLLGKAGIYKKMNQVDTAIIILEKLIKLKPDYTDAYNSIAECYGQYLKDYDKAIIYLQQSYKLNPKDQHTLENLGVVYGIKGEYNKSLLFLNEAYQLDSSSAKLCINIGKTHELLGNIREANRFYEKAKRVGGKSQ